MHSSIYFPSEDSYLLQDSLKQYLKDKPKSINILEIGSGSGILAKTCIDGGFKNILATDINLESVKHLKKQGVNSINSDLFKKIKDKFDLIIFNPPYLPEDSREPEYSKIQTTAGKKGYEIILKFLKQAKNNLSKNGAILLLFSSLSKPNIIKRELKKQGFKHSLINSASLPFFEELYVYKIVL